MCFLEKGHQKVAGCSSVNFVEKSAALLTRTVIPADSGSVYMRLNGAVDVYESLVLHSGKIGVNRVAAPS